MIHLEVQTVHQKLRNYISNTYINLFFAINNQKG